jgi:hypothetical protein
MEAMFTMRHDSLAADERTIEVDFHHLTPLIVGQVGDRLVDAGDARVVDENIDAAECLQGGGGGGLDGFNAGHVDFERHYGGADFACGFFRQRLVEIPDRDFRARSHEAFGDGAAKALRTTGDDGESSGQINLVQGVSPDRILL